MLRIKPLTCFSLFKKVFARAEVVTRGLTEVILWVRPPAPKVFASSWDLFGTVQDRTLVWGTKKMQSEPHSRFCDEGDWKHISICEEQCLWRNGRYFLLYFSSNQFSPSVMSDSLQPHGLQHARLHCPSPIARAYSNSCPLSRWCHPTISSSLVPLGWTGWISPRDSQESSPTSHFKSINSSALSFLYSPTVTSIRDYWKNHSFD